MESFDTNIDSLLIQHTGDPRKLETALNEVGTFFPGVIIEGNFAAVQAGKRESGPTIRMPGILVELKVEKDPLAVISYLRGKGITVILEQLTGGPVEVTFGDAPEAMA
jgi:hypothetical protein